MAVYADLESLVFEVREKLGLKPNSALNRAFFKQCMGHIFRLGGAWDTAWDNSGVGDQGQLAITQGEGGMGAQVVALPGNLVRVYRVEWHNQGNNTDNALDLVTLAWLDKNMNGWRGETSQQPEACAVEATRLLLSAAPTGPCTGYLVVRGYGIPDADVALSLLPDDLQLGPAYFMLWRLPYNPNDEAQAAIHAQYKEIWLGTPGVKDVPGMERQLIEAFRQRKNRPWSYRG